MGQEKQPLVDEKLYVNEATLEALRNEIEFEVRRSLLWNVLVPMLAVGILLFLIGVFLVLPRKVSTLIREDPIVSERFRGATAEYLDDPEGGKKAISEEIKRMLESDIEIQKTVEESVQAALSEVNMAEVVKNHVDDVLKEKPLAGFVTEFLKKEEGQALLKKATQEYFASPEGIKELGNAASQELNSTTFREILINDLDRILNQ
jgi:hypothetical protein